MAYREAVRLEGPLILPALPDAVRGKYSTYLKRWTLRPPARYFTDHNYAQKLLPVMDLVRRGTTRTVLDAACGNGFEAVLFALHGGRVHANDVTSARAIVAGARQDFYHDLLGGTLDLHVTCGNAIDLADVAADVVFVQEAISHIHPAEAFVAQVAARLLAPGGRFVVCDSNGGNPVTRARISRHLWEQRRTLRHYVVEVQDPETGRAFLMAEERLFGPPGIRRILRKAGLEVERIVMSGFVLPRMLGAPASSRLR